MALWSASQNDELMQRLQAVQKAAARLIVGARMFDPVSYILCDLHWLPVRQRITFKLCVLAYKCLHGMAPPYLSEFHMPTLETAENCTVQSWALTSYRTSCGAG